MRSSTNSSLCPLASRSSEQGHGHFLTQYDALPCELLDGANAAPSQRALWSRDIFLAPPCHGPGTSLVPNFDDNAVDHYQALPAELNRSSSHKAMSSNKCY